MFSFDAEAFESLCRHLIGLCPAIAYESAGQVGYYEGTTALVVEDLERMRDILVAVGMPSPPPGVSLSVPRMLPGNESCVWRPCPSSDHWKFEFERAVKDCVADHKALQDRSCALGRERHQAMREADRLFAEGKDGAACW